MRRCWTALALATLLLVAGCTGDPSGDRPATSRPSAPAASASASASPSPEPPPLPFTAEALREAVTRDGLAAHLRALAAIATAHGGERSAGTPGYAASVGYASEVLRQAGFRVRPHRFDMPIFRVLAQSRLEGAGLDLRDGRDFRAALYSGSGLATGVVANAGLGCSGAEFGALAPGGVALVRHGSCFTSSKVRNAQAAGAAAVLVVRTDSVAGAPIRPTLGSPDGIEVPVLALTPPAGEAVGALAGSEVTVEVRAESPTVRVSSVVAEIGPRSGPVLMAGGHLDSVIDGPGINDNGSGTAAVLTLGQALGRVRNPPRIRVALWGGEEYLLLGSTAYVDGLDAAERDVISGYVNYDMVGSPNAVHLVYDGDPAIRDALITGLRGLPYELEPMQGNSDHAPFEDAGIDVGGIFTGALEPVTQGQAARYGSVAGAPADPCYHQPCDDIGNVDVVLAERLADALAEAVVILTRG